MADLGRDSDIAVSADGGGGWSLRVVDAAGRALIESPLGGRIRLGDVRSIVSAYVRRVTLGGVVVENPNFGDVVVGKSPNGYAQPFRHSPGGAVIIPYVIDRANREAYIGVLSVTRGLVGAGKEPVSEIPRGFVNAGIAEAHKSAAKREVMEETGIGGALADRVVELTGVAMNADSAFFVSDPAAGEGVRVYALALYPDEIVVDRSNPHTPVGRLSPALFEGIKEINEKINPDGLKFLRVQDAVLTSDNFTRGAAGALWGHLLETGAVQVANDPPGIS